MWEISAPSANFAVKLKLLLKKKNVCLRNISNNILAKAPFNREKSKDGKKSSPNLLFKLFIIAKHSSKQFYLLLLSLSFFLSSLSLENTHTHSCEYGMGVQFYIHGFMITYHVDMLILS